MVPFRRFHPVASGVGRDGTPSGQCMVRRPIASEKLDEEKWSAAMYSACDEAIASGHDVLRALLFLSSMSASNALPKDRLQAGPI